MLFKQKGVSILAALTGQVISITDVESPIFAGKVVGDGVAIIPTSPEVIAPISGTISFIGEQKHTYGITGFDGIEVLIHLGIGTVSLNGEGFTPLVKTGPRVNAGDRICIVNWEEIKNKGFDITSPEVITSTAIDKIKRLTLTTGFATAGISACMRYVIK